MRTVSLTDTKRHQITYKRRMAEQMAFPRLIREKTSFIG